MGTRWGVSVSDTLLGFPVWASSSNIQTTGSSAVLSTPTCSLSLLLPRVYPTLSSQASSFLCPVALPGRPFFFYFCPEALQTFLTDFRQYLASGSSAMECALPPVSPKVTYALEYCGTEQLAIFQRGQCVRISTSVPGHVTQAATSSTHISILLWFCGEPQIKS